MEGVGLVFFGFVVIFALVIFFGSFFRCGQAFSFFAMTLRAFSMLLPQAATLSMTNFPLRREAHSSRGKIL